jgi:hypothetical protein
MTVLAIRRVVIVVLAGVTLAGPFEEATATPISQAVADTIVRQSDRPAYPRGGTLVAEKTIGTTDGAQEYMFGSVRDVLELRDGSTLVVDAQPFAVRHYDAAGKYLRTFGRQGQGPGEYVRPSTVAVLRDGRIVVLDGGNRRINVYSPTGESVDTWSLTTGGRSGVATRLIVDTSGTAVVTTTVPVSDTVSETGFLRFAPNGRLIDTVRAPAFAYRRPFANVSTGTMRGGAVIPFYPETRVVWSPLGHIVSGLPNRYAFELLRPGRRPTAPGDVAIRLGDAVALPALRYRGPTPAWAAGDSIISIRRRVEPIVISSEQRDVERAGVESVMQQLVPGSRFTGPEIPRVKPAYKDLRIGEDGTIWVHVSMPGERYTPDPPANPQPGSGPVPPRWREPSVYDVFEPDGRYLGRVPHPNNIRILRMTRDRAWGTLADEDGVQTVRRFRIDWR